MPKKDGTWEKGYLVNPAGMPTSHPAEAPKETIPTWNVID